MNDTKNPQKTFFSDSRGYPCGCWANEGLYAPDGKTPAIEFCHMHNLGEQLVHTSFTSKLNPRAYRECVEALKQIKESWKLPKDHYVSKAISDATT